MMVKKWSDDTPRINKIDVLDKSSQGTTRYVAVGAQTSFSSSADARSIRSTLYRGAQGDPITPTKPLKVTYLSGVLEADLRAIGQYRKRHALFTRTTRTTREIEIILEII